MNHIMAVCDEEEIYALKLVEYLNLKEGFPFETVYFENIDKLQEYTQRHMPDLVLAGESMEEELRSFLSKDQLILLSRTGIQNEEYKKCIYKYQSCEIIIREILKIMADRNTGNRIVERKRSLILIGLFSPVRRLGQTVFALQMGDLLARKNRVLYLNLEPFSGLEEIIHKPFEKELSDLLYYIQNEKKGIQYLLGSMVMEQNGLSILPPMICQPDLISIAQEEWIRLFREMEKYSDYEYLILDLSESVQGLFEILRQCDYIYTLTEDSNRAEAKLHYYTEALIKSGYEDVIDKQKYCTLPDQKTPFSDRNLENYIKKILQEDFYDK